MQVDWMLTILAVGVVVVFWSFWQAHRRPDFDFNALDLLMENGRVSRTAVLFMLAGLVSTWVIVNREINGTLTEGFFGLWLTAWVAPLVVAMNSKK